MEPLRGRGDPSSRATARRSRARYARRVMGRFPTTLAVALGVHAIIVAVALRGRVAPAPQVLVETTVELDEEAALSEATMRAESAAGVGATAARGTTARAAVRI